ncbi:SMI1/KNR4 family protein [Frankia sp. R43]|uniref:SMI1/KNR4 family protein n=1 Tax=Frankia sp. R43 TaxID=269536 RepID=UPI000A80814D|nr:SMI1/KNR4 family protein [Frankia sp. R43]
MPALAAMRNVFYEEPDRPKFYDLNGIRATSVAWQSGYPGVEFQEFYLGVENSEKPPGNLTPHQSLIIGDLGPDMPFALDYRASCSRPAVVELTTYDNWRYVADDIDEFLEKLGLAS